MDFLTISGIINPVVLPIFLSSRCWARTITLNFVINGIRWCGGAIAIEPPELIGTGRAISTERPHLITKAVDSVKSAKNSTKLLCGAGIVSGKDVARAKELGAKGILVASGIVKAKNWEKIIEEFSRALV